MCTNTYKRTETRETHYLLNHFLMAATGESTSGSYLSGSSIGFLQTGDNKFRRSFIRSCVRAPRDILHFCVNEGHGISSRYLQPTHFFMRLTVGYCVYLNWYMPMHPRRPWRDPTYQTRGRRVKRPLRTKAAGRTRSGNFLRMMSQIGGVF